MNFLSEPERRGYFKPYLITWIIIGALYAILEYIARAETEDPQEFIPLLIRAIVAVVLIMLSVGYFELFSKSWLKNKTFILIVLARSVSYTLIITLVLIVVNGFWGIINRGISFGAAVRDYITDASYLVNLMTILMILTIFIAFRQINSLHRKGELLDFVLGRYHEPKEINRIFCFIDLRGSTTIGEKLGHYQFAHFLKDYYSDITDAIRKTEAEIYQYVGDEIILCWPYNKGLKNNNIINCFFMMQAIIHQLKDNYLEKYGVFPEFKAGLHGGKVTVTWVGEIKKEIVFLGDVLNTTARIQENCNRLSKDFLISKDLLDLIDDLGEVKASFVEETVLRGKAKSVKMYSLELNN